MRTFGLVILALSAILVSHEGALSQAREPLWDLGFRASFSRSYVDHGFRYETHWGESIGAQARFYFLQFFHIEATVSRVDARDLKNCWDCFATSYLHRPLAAFTGGGGIQARIGGWMPFAGIGRGRIWNTRIDRQTWVPYSGVEYSPFPNFSGFLEYRTTRAKWSVGDVGWSWDLGLGIGWRLRGTS